jgi:hypothetical protein
VHEDVVAEVDELLPARQRLLADLGERDHRLDARPVARLQRGEAELAGVPAEDDASGDAHHDARLGSGLELAVLRPKSGNGVRDRHADGERAARRIRSLLDEALALGETDGLLLVDVLLGVGCGRGRVGRGGHGGSLKVASEFTGRLRAPRPVPS